MCIGCPDPELAMTNVSSPKMAVAAFVSGMPVLTTKEEYPPIREGFELAIKWWEFMGYEDKVIAAKKKLEELDALYL